MVGRRILIALTIVAVASIVGVPSAAAANPAATIGPVDCVRGGAIATFTNTASAPLPYTLLRGDVVLDHFVLPPSPTATTRLIPIAEGATSQITVRTGDAYVSANVTRSCEGRTRSAAASSPAAASSAVAGLTPTFASVRIAAPTPANTAFATSTSAWVFVALAALVLTILAALTSARVRSRLRHPGRSREPAARQRA